MEIPKIFWRYYDLFRRKKLSLTQFSEKTGLNKRSLRLFLKEISESQK